MSKIKLIQSKIMQLEGGAFQSLFDEYLYKKYKFTNIQTLGVQTGTNKPTKGTPDTYVETDDEKYILINYGSVSSQPVDKIKADILSCFNTAKLSLEKDKIKMIICGHCSTNIHIEQRESIKKLIDGVDIKLIGIDTLSHDLAVNYPHIAKDWLGVEIDSNQFFDIEDFVKAYDTNGMNAPIECDFLHRKVELDLTCDSICNNKITVLTGASGIGKTRLAIEVCRVQEEKKYKVYCIRSNGSLLYEDIKLYLHTPGRYLLFFDDANMVVSLKYVLQTLFAYSDDYEFKILITVRDYAKERVITTVREYTEPEIIMIERFSDEEIKDILEKNLGILNYEYLNKILDIANGNARLAFLAGLRSVDEGYSAICNAEDIFKNYYGHIINSAELTKDDVIMLFLIAVAGPVKEGENHLYNNLKEKYGAGIRDSETVEKLYSLELVDWFKNEITKISDQSLGNYIIYYILFEKKWVSIEKLLAISFPKYRNKVVYAINTIIEIFNSDEVINYVKKSIISAWNNASEEQEIEYLEAFYQIDIDRSLLIIKKKIEQEKCVNYDLHNFDFKEKNYHSFFAKEIEILGGLKYTEAFDDSVELLILYFKKRPDLINDFCFVISESMLYDKHSSKNGYKNEIALMDKLWNVTDEGKNFNFSILYIYVAKYALRTQFSYTENKRNSKSISWVTMKIDFTKEIALLRKKIWETFVVLRNNDEYCEKINEILLEVHIEGLNKENLQKYLKFDFDTIFPNFIKSEDIDFGDAMIIDSYREFAEKIGSSIDKRYLLAEKNSEFRLYKILSQEYIRGKTFEEQEKIRKDSISAEIRSYNLEDFVRLFEICNFLQEKIYDSKQGSLDSGLNIVFELLEKDINFYVSVIEVYFKNNAPFRLNGYRQVKFLLSNIGYEKTYSMMNEVEYRNKDTWLSLIWECINESDITDKVVCDYNSFSERNLNGDNPIVPSIMLLEKYGKRDNRLKNRIIKRIVKKASLSAKFLGYMYRDDVKVILELFKDDYDSLSQIYINAIEQSNNGDYDGKLFIKIFEQRPNIWKEYVNWVKNNICCAVYKQKIFELIWSTEKWQECIKYAYSVLFEDDMASYIEYSARLLFGPMEQELNVNQNRKKQWLIDSLHENYMDASKCRKLIDVVVNVWPQWKLDFILEFLKKNDNIEDFKEIHLFPISASWSGSEVPLIIDKIKFLQSLKEKIKGIAYIEHREYIEDYRRKLEEYKRKVELKEYMEEADYA